jgi:hypothetical protein
MNESDSQADQPSDRPADPAVANSPQASPPEKTPVVVPGWPEPSYTRLILVVAAAVLMLPAIATLGLILIDPANNSPALTQAQRMAAEQVLEAVRVELQSAGFAPSATTQSEPYDCLSGVSNSMTGERITETSFAVDRVRADMEGGTVEVGDVVGRTLEDAGATELGQESTDDPNQPGYTEPSRYWEFDGATFQLMNQYQSAGTLATLSLIPPC